MRSAKWLLVMAVVSVIALGACGGSDDKGDSKALTKDELIEKGDAICDDYDTATREIEFPDLPAGGQLDDLDDDQLEALSKYIGENIKVFSNQLDDLDALVPPSDLEKDWDALIDDLEEMKSAFEAGHAAVDDRDQEAFDSFDAEIAKLGSAASAKAEDLGFETCGQ